MCQASSTQWSSKRVPAVTGSPYTCTPSPSFLFFFFYNLFLCKDKVFSNILSIQDSLEPKGLIGMKREGRMWYWLLVSFHTETLALDAHVGCPGCSDSHRAVCARSGQSFSMRAFLESVHRPPSRSWHHSHAGDKQNHFLPFYLLKQQKCKNTAVGSLL